MKERVTLIDILVLLVFFFISLTGWFGARTVAGSSDTVTVMVDGKKRFILDLKEEGTYRVKGPIGETLIEIKDGRVRVRDSDCPRKFCVRQGWIRTGAIVCVPNRVVVSVGESLPEGVDAISE
ncbi:MAG: NusG domain II-containing protein [Nitrospirae bacterium]|nr:MAG: NusG domain II-containing protein [Nitrospirota bacterium]